MSTRGWLLFTYGVNAIEPFLEEPLGVRGRLSPRQREVLDGILAGKPNRIIAQELVLSTRTVEAHRAAIMTKIGVSSVAELVRATARTGDGSDGLDTMCRIYPGLVSFWDTGLVARFANKRHEACLGKTVDEILGSTIDEVLGARCYRHSIPFIQAVLGGQTQYLTQVVRSPSRRPMTFCSAYSPQFDALGDVAGFFSFMIESRFVADDERVISREDGDAACWAEMILDDGNRIVSVNEAFTNVTQFEGDEVRGQTPIMIRPPGIEPTVFMKFWSDILPGSGWNGTVWYRRRDGYLFRSRQQVTTDCERLGPGGFRVRFSEIKVP